MTLTISPPTPATRRSTRPKPSTRPKTGKSQRSDHTKVRPKTGASPRTGRAHVRRETGMVDERQALGRYTDSEGRPREVVARPGLAGSVLGMDRDAATLGDLRLVAHLGADEPTENAVVVTSCYLEDIQRRPFRCRHVTAEDLEIELFADGEEEEELLGGLAPSETKLVDQCGRSYLLELLQTGMSIPELRWRQHPPEGAEGEARVVSLREVIACLESYEPVRTLTVKALAPHRGDLKVSITVLRAELERVLESPIVLNRGLRQAVLAAAAAQGLSMSEIAIRCGRVKHDSRGNESGETGWLARRLGILPEGGGSMPTPWIHNDVLALIARHGLGIAPREVELG